jgi:hypothetical protein
MTTPVIVRCLGRPLDQASFGRYDFGVKQAIITASQLSPDW